MIIEEHFMLIIIVVVGEVIVKVLWVKMLLYSSDDELVK
jgi:hypothetical protein